MTPIVVVVELPTEITLSSVIVVDLAAKIILAAISHAVTIELLTKITRGVTIVHLTRTMRAARFGSRH